MLKRTILYWLILALLATSCSTLTSDDSEGAKAIEQQAAFEPVEFRSLNLAGPETLNTLQTKIEQVRTPTSDVRSTLVPLLYLLPTGDYGIDHGWIFAVDSRLEHTAGRSWRGGEYEISMNAMYQTDSSSYEQVVARVKTSTFTSARGELTLSSEGEGNSADLGVQVTATEMVFFSSDGVSEKFTVVVKKDSDHPELVEINVTYSLSPDTDDELRNYVENLAGWARMYPDLEGGQIAEVGFGTNEFGYAQSVQLGADTSADATIPLYFTYEYEYLPNIDGPRSDGEREELKTSAELEAEVRSSLLEAGWSTVEGGVLSETFTATAPDETEHGVTIDPYRGWASVSYVHRAKVAAAVG